MNLADPKLTLRLEPALRFMINNPEVGINRLAQKFDLDRIELFAWLKKYKGPSGILTATRIDEVKAQLGAIVVRSAPHRPAPEPAAPPPAAASEPSKPDNNPWMKIKSVREKPLRRALEAMEDMLQSSEAYTTIALKHGMTISAWSVFKSTYLGAGPLEPIKVKSLRAFLDARAQKAAEPPAPPEAPFKRQLAGLKRGPYKKRTPEAGPPAGPAIRIDPRVEAPLAPVVVPIILRVQLELGTPETKGNAKRK